MKKWMSRSVALLMMAVLFLLPGVRVFADDMDSGSAQALTMKDKLGLTDAQVTQLKALVAAEKAEYGPLVKQQLADLKVLGDQIKAKAPDDQVKTTMDRLENGRLAIAAAKTKYIGQAKAILNPTQQGKLLLAVVIVKLGALKKLAQ
jgi:Spy/CpxP family protein refolding chaperone